MNNQSSLITLLPYQKKWLADQSRFKIGMFARQTGKTFTTALELVEDFLAGEAAKTPTRWVWMAQGERQAKNAIETAVKPHLRMYGAAFNAIEFDFEGDLAKYKALEITGRHGSRIIAIPANPDTARGFSDNVVLDEFAIHKDSRAIWGAMFPIVSRRNLKLRITSTPNGKNNKFYELMTGQDKVWSRHTVDIYQAVEQGLDRDIDELRAGMGDQDLGARVRAEVARRGQRLVALRSHLRVRRP